MNPCMPGCYSGSSAHMTCTEAASVQRYLRREYRIQIHISHTHTHLVAQRPYDKNERQGGQMDVWPRRSARGKLGRHGAQHQPTYPKNIGVIFVQPNTLVEGSLGKGAQVANLVCWLESSRPSPMSVDRGSHELLTKAMVFCLFGEDVEEPPQFPHVCAHSAQVLPRGAPHARSWRQCRWQLRRSSASW